MTWLRGFLHVIVGTEDEEFDSLECMTMAYVTVLRRVERWEALRVDYPRFSASY